MGQRRKSREFVLQLLFQSEVNYEKGASSEPQTLLKNIFETESMDRTKLDACKRAEEMFFNIWEKKSEIDELIEKVSENWKVSRMSHIDRNILRMATYELLYCKDTPREVVLDEAIEIAKRFGTEESGSFVNGILDKIWKTYLGA